MKRLMICTLLAACLSLYGFAESVQSAENCNSFNTGLSCGGFMSLEEGICSGYGEWNIPIIHNQNGFILHNSINIGGFGIEDVISSKTQGGFFVGDKIILGADYSNQLYSTKTYGFLGTDFYFTEDLVNHFWTEPVVLNLRLGGGFEFQYNKNSAFVIEFGGKNNFVLGNASDLNFSIKNYSPFINVGFRSYYN